MTPKDERRDTGTVPLPDLDIPRLNEHLEQLSAGEILAWTWKTFGPEAATSSSFNKTGFSQARET